MPQSSLSHHAFGLLLALLLLGRLGGGRRLLGLALLVLGDGLLELGLEDLLRLAHLGRGEG